MAMPGQKKVMWATMHKCKHNEMKTQRFFSRITGRIVTATCIAVMTVLVASCKPGVPDEYIQPGEMEDILYDYHLASAMADQGDPSQRGVLTVAYRKAVLQKYGYTERQWDTSMRYYARHSDQLHDIYDALAERLNDEAKELGGDGTDLTLADDMNQTGDTANVWRNATAMVLAPTPGNNSMTFSLKADTAYHKGDKLSLEFNSSYIIQDGMRNAVAVLALTLGNDSVTSQTLRITSDSHQLLAIADNDSLGIKSVRGYFLLPPDQNAQPTTTLKILCVNRIRLVRMHPKKKPATAQ